MVSVAVILTVCLSSSGTQTEMFGRGVTSQISRTGSTGNTVIFRPAKVSINIENSIETIMNNEHKLNKELVQKTLNSHHLDYEN